MSEVKVTELRQNLPEYLAEVRKGKELKVTVRGKVIARIVPASENGEIAWLSRSSQFARGDPADRIISATALYNRARLVTADARLRSLRAIDMVW